MIRTGQSRMLTIFVGLTISLNFAHCLRGDDGDARELPSIAVEFAAEPEMPKRQLTFPAPKEAVSIELFAADPKLLKQQYVAIVTLRWPKIDRNEYYRMVNPRETTTIDSQRRVFWMHLTNRANSDSSRSSRSALRVDAGELLTLLAKSVPDERKPPAELLSLLTDEHHIRVVEQESDFNASFRSSGNRDIEVVQVIRLLGPDKETTKAMSLALLDLYDYGVSRPVQQHLIADMQQRKARLPMILANLQEEQAGVAEIEKQVDKLESITDDTIRDLNTQKRLIAVDIAGAQARIDACEQLLKRKQFRGQAAIEQVESIKITAEIELVGLTARQNAVAKIIDEGVQRRVLATSLLRKRSKVSQAADDIESEIRAISSLEESRKLYLPIAVANNEIPIQPIEWQPAANASGFGRP